MGEVRYDFSRREQKMKTYYVWKYAKIVEIPEGQREIYDNYDRRLDVENAKTFKKTEFLAACKEMGITKDLS